jgi:hypothetical protein
LHETSNKGKSRKKGPRHQPRAYNPVGFAAALQHRAAICKRSHYQRPMRANRILPFDTATGVLNITGTGEISNRWGSSYELWENQFVKTITIANGITRIVPIKS